MDLGVLLENIWIFVVMLVGEAFGTLFGGGSFFVQPGLILAGVPAKLAIANDVCAAAFASLSFIFGNKRITPHTKKCTAIAAPGLIVGAFVGGHVLRAVPDIVSALLVFVICLSGAVYVLTHLWRTEPQAQHSPREPIRWWVPALAITGLFLGFYDGMSGAGSGVILIALLSLILRQDMKTILALANMVSFISLGAAGLTFWYVGLLDVRLLAIMIPAALLAGIVARHICELLPERILRIVYACVLCALLAYFAIHMVGKYGPLLLMQDG